MAALMISKLLFLLTLTLLALNYNIAEGAIPGNTQRQINKVNKEGPYVGIVAGSKSEMDLILQHPSFTDYEYTIEVAGKRFRFGGIGGVRVIVVMSGSSLINTGITTQLLVSLFRLKVVVHTGVAGIVDPSLNIGDVIIPRVWSHSGLWTWQRFGSGPEDKLPLEDAGEQTRELGYLRFADHAVNVGECSNHDNLLNNIWYQPEEVFPVNGNLEERQHKFWIPADSQFLDIANNLEDMDLDLEKCTPTSCLDSTPKVSRIGRGTSASIYIDNAAYGNFLKKKFKVGAVDMKTAAVALICYQQQVPFIAIKSLSDVAGGGSSEAENYVHLAAKNSVTVTVEFVKLLPEHNIPEPVFDM